MTAAAPSDLPRGVKIVGVRYVYGVAPLRPFLNPPEGRVRIRMRPRAVACAFIRTAEGIEKRWLIACEGGWELGEIVASNTTLPLP